MNEFNPEGFLIDKPENKASLSSPEALTVAKNTRKILESRALLCDSNHNLLLDLGCMKGIIPREEGAMGIKDGTTRDITIISRVNKPVCFVVLGFEQTEKLGIRAVLSRKAAQEMCLENKISNLSPGDVIPARVTHLENFGAFVDIGCGIVSFLPIDTISVSRIAHPNERFTVGMDIKVIVKSISADRVNITHKELLGSWQENACLFHIGETVSGIVRSVEDYGIFVELTPNLAGLAEPKENVKQGQQASVYIKNIIVEKMKIKLVIIESFESIRQTSPPKYFFDGEHIEKFVYSPKNCSKLIETEFANMPNCITI
jgi:small subunit ribosomal protein S1